MIRKLTVALLVLCQGASVMASTIPLEDFFKNPEQAGFTISPDGKSMAYLKPWERRLNVYVRKLDGPDEVKVTADKNRDIRQFVWKGNDTILYLQDKGGDENFHLFATQIKNPIARDLTPFDDTRVMIENELPQDDDHVLITMNRRDKKVFDVFRLNVKTGELTEVARNPGDYAGWLTDHEGRVRAAARTDGADRVMMYRATEKDPFRDLIKVSYKDDFGCYEFTADNQQLYCGSNLGRDTIALVQFDPATGKEVKEIFAPKEFDLSGILFSRKNKTMMGAAWEGPKEEYQVFDNAWKPIFADLEKQLAGYEFTVLSWDKDETRLTLMSYSDRSRGRYYWYDVKSKKLNFLAEAAPWLKEADLAEMKPITYKSRDGLTIHGYLTLPKYVDHQNLPVVIHPHGGPWARDSWGFNSQVQFLANRGYAVLQMNFRGSTGFGKSFKEKSFKQWGRTMQDDITDGVNWLVTHGTADPKRICIYGASYGGYATLAGVTFTPDLYACGVDYVGVSNLFTFQETIPPYWESFRKQLHEMVGHPEKDKELLQAASPVFHADKIKAPLFVAQGANDPRVKKSESDQIVASLKRRGVDVLYMVKDNEGHGFRNEENRFDFFRQMEKFLAQHIGKTEPKKPKKKSS